VIGAGNVVLSDDGAGVHAVRRLRARWALPDDIEVVEGGTAGLLLLPHLADAERAILVDAMDAGDSPGAIRRLDGAAVALPFATRWTPHDTGLADLLGAAALAGVLPEELVIVAVQIGSTALGTEMTPAVAAALDPLVDTIAAQLAAWGCSLRENQEDQQHEEGQGEPHQPEDDDRHVA
jgi:hydrogenase maturation protease